MANDSEYWDLLKDSPEFHEEFNYDVNSKQVIEAFTPTARVRFHDPNDAVAFEREKREENREVSSREVERLIPKLRGPRG
jgi:hypothetical protein